MTGSVLLEETVALTGNQERIWEFDLNHGELIKGIVEEQDGDWLKIFFLDEDNYAKRKQGASFKYWGGTGIGAYRFNVQIAETDTYYLIVGHNDWWGRPESVRIKLRRF